jgi:hypothetical protein
MYAYKPPRTKAWSLAASKSDPATNNAEPPQNSEAQAALRLEPVTDTFLDLKKQIQGSPATPGGFIRFLAKLSERW